MNLYTHAVLAIQLQAKVNPESPADYLWGAVAPDIRYLAQMRRQATHLPDEETAQWFARYPGCKSFIQGYRVHCLVDRIDAVKVMSSAFPLNLLRLIRRKSFSPQQMAVVIELYYHKTFSQGLALVGSHNPVLEELGIRADQTKEYVSALAGYLAAPSFDTAFSCFSRLGIVEDTRIERYINAYKSINNRRLLLNALMANVKNARLEKLTLSMYQDGQPEGV